MYKLSRKLRLSSSTTETIAETYPVNELRPIHLRNKQAVAYLKVQPVHR
jgi:hypothetical protein